VTCGSGGQTQRTRTILVDAANGGAACPSLDDLTETEACNEAVSHVAFSILMASFLLPTPFPRRPPSPYPPTFSSSPSKSNSSHQACPVPCRVTSWGPWGSCDATCGGGNQYRSSTSSIYLSCPGQTESKRCATEVSEGERMAWGVCWGRGRKEILKKAKERSMSR